jgi:hypothetical protein
VDSAISLTKYFAAITMHCGNANLEFTGIHGIYCISNPDIVSLYRCTNTLVKRTNDCVAIPILCEHANLEFLYIPNK